MARKSLLGQNFLICSRTALDIVLLLDVQANDTILEIGPGKGILTREITNMSPNKLYAVEISSNLVKYLNNCKFAKKASIINKDIRDVNFEDFCHGNSCIKIVSNLPFYISKFFFNMLLSNCHKISTVVAVMQLDLVKKIITNKYGSSKSYWGVVLNSFFTIQPKYKINNSCFRPSPKVDAMSIIMKSKHLNINYIEFLEFTKNIFKYRKKKIINTEEYANLSRIINNHESSLRPHQISCNRYLELFALSRRIKE